MSLRDEFDERRFGPMGQVIGVKYGGFVHQPTITYSNIPQRLPDPGPRYGESRPPIIIDNTDGAFENPFYRTPRYGGGLNIPGAPGNIQNFLYRTATPSFEIPGGQTPYKRGPYLPFEDIPEENEPFIPLPLAAVGRDQQPAQGPNTPIRNYPQQKTERSQKNSYIFLLYLFLGENQHRGKQHLLENGMDAWQS